MNNFQGKASANKLIDGAIAGAFLLAVSSAAFSCPVGPLVRVINETGQSVQVAGGCGAGNEQLSPGQSTQLVLTQGISFTAANGQKLEYPMAKGEYNYSLVGNSDGEGCHANFGPAQGRGLSATLVGPNNQQSSGSNMAMSDKLCRPVNLLLTANASGKKSRNM
jgi:hypothetical protein